MHVNKFYIDTTTKTFMDQHHEHNKLQLIVFAMNNLTK